MNTPKLPDLPQEAFVLNPELERIYRILWSVDPAHLRRLDPGILAQITKINIEYRAATAELEAKMKQTEADSLRAIGQVIAKGGG